MTNERHDERQPSDDELIPRSEKDQRWLDQLALCQQAAELRVTMSYPQIAEVQGCCWATAYNRVQNWHTWVARTTHLESVRGQLSQRYEWVVRALIEQYAQVLEESKSAHGPEPHCGEHKKHDPKCKRCVELQENVPIITPWGRVRMLRQILASIADITERQAKLFGLVTDSPRIALAAYAESSSKTTTRRLPKDPKERAKVLKALQAVRRKTRDEDGSE